ncbi:MAG: hypothetical protein KTR24_06905 [Saprospiraceae bacterium]|nr:hypothetical protein [Saprospiraceae bacterium]
MATRSLRDGYQTIIVLSLAALIIGYFAYADYCYIVALSLLGGALLSPFFVRTIDKIWMAFAAIIGKISSTILLSSIFFLLLTPLAILSRLTAKESEFEINKEDRSSFRNIDPKRSVNFSKPW